MNLKHLSKRHLPIITFTQKVYVDITGTIGARNPECGGILGSSNGSNIVDYFYFDKSANTSKDTYTPNINEVNDILLKWNTQGIRMVGIIHSHPTDFDSPSKPDQLYAARILNEIKENYFLLPILNKSLKGKQVIHGFYAYRAKGSFNTSTGIDVVDIYSCNTCVF